MTKEKGSKLTRVGVFYDGNYFWHVSSFYAQHHERKSRLSIGGLHRFLKYQIAQMEDSSPELTRIVDAHYFRGRLSAAEAAKAKGDVLFYERVFEDVLNSEGVLMHYLPLWSSKGKKKEKGVDVLFALETYERTIHQEFDVVVLVAADGDYLPLVRKLQALGTRVMILGWDLKHETDHKEQITTFTSYDLMEEATYPVMMNELIDSRTFRNDPIINGLFVNRNSNTEDRREIKGRPYQAPAARLRSAEEKLKDEQTNQEQPTEEAAASAISPEQSSETLTPALPETKLLPSGLASDIAPEPIPELTLTVKESVATPVVKVIGHIDLTPSAKKEKPSYSSYGEEKKDESAKPRREERPHRPLGTDLGDDYILGRILTLKTGFGFIDVGTGENAFFHYKSLSTESDLRFQDLLVGDYVEVRLHHNERGKLEASNILLAEESTTSQD